MGCLRLIYNLKTVSKTEGTLIFEIGGKQVSDYYLFGMLSDACFLSNEKHSRTNSDVWLDSERDETGQMPDRNSEREYRYGFQGQEKIDEIVAKVNTAVALTKAGISAWNHTMGRVLSKMEEIGVK